MAVRICYIRRGRSRGVAIITALFIVLLIMGWGIASLARVQSQTGFTKLSDRRATAYYLAKTAANRALDTVNQPGGGGWLTQHKGKAAADSSLAKDTLVWDEDVPGGTNAYLIQAEATVSPLTERVTIGVAMQASSDTKLFSAAPSTNGGPDVIAWSTVSSTTWDALPPIPGFAHLEQVTPLPSGDVYAVANDGSNHQALWRFRQGRGWLMMPPPPNNVKIGELSSGGDSRLVTRGSDNSLLVLQLTPTVKWTSATPPGGGTLGAVAADPSQGNVQYAVVNQGSGAGIYRYDTGTQSWSAMPGPTHTTYDPVSGATLQSGGAVTDLSGGLAVDSSGKVYAASNESGSASTLYGYTPGANGAPGTWAAEPPIPQMSWDSTRTQLAADSGYVTDVSHLRADDQGRVWMQWARPNAPDEVLLFTPNAQPSGSTPGLTPAPAPPSAATPDPSAAATPDPNAAATPDPNAAATPDPSAPAAKDAVRTVKAMAKEAVRVAAPTTDSGLGPSTGTGDPGPVGTNGIAANGPNLPSTNTGSGGNGAGSGASTSVYAIFTARPDFSLDTARDQFSQLSTWSTQDQLNMGVGPGLQAGQTHYVPVAER